MSGSRTGRGGLVILGGLVALSLIALVGQTIRPVPLRFAGMTIDRLSAVLTLLVASIGAVTYRFSLRYLDGDRQQGMFLLSLAWTILSAYWLMLSTNLLLLFIAWTLTSMGLHRLLTYYRERPEAIRAARKKFLISRLGDTALIAAILVIYTHAGTFDLHEFLAAPGIAPGTYTLIGFLVALAAITKSAQFPFHSWLPETMESPTPVSALMHAGIINAGGALLLRFAPLMVRLPEVLLFLVVLGTLTLTLGMLAMWAQTKVKRTLAWSTVSQMGFMMVQCGLGAFPAAAVHLVGHGCYKAWSFLRSGELPSTPRGVVNAPTPQRALILASIGVLLSIPALMLASTWTGFAPLHSPGELALTAIVALSIGQLWIALLGPGLSLRRGLAAFIGTFLTASGAFAIYEGATLYLAPVLGELPAPSGLLAWMAAVLPVVVLMGLMIVHACLPLLGRTPTGRAFYVHSLHGFYFGTMADQVVAAIWPTPAHTLPGAKHA